MTGECTAMVLRNPGGGSVAPFGCPDCGEDRPDYLAINDDDCVHCASCGAEYIAA